LSWHRQKPGPPGLVIGYAAHTPDRLIEAAGRIGRAIGQSSSTVTKSIRRSIELINGVSTSL
jgi:GntR family transcriptional regulator/MocR family aminotransferase